MKVINNFPCMKIAGFCLLVMAVFLLRKYMSLEDPSLELPDRIVRPIIPAVPEEDVWIEVGFL